jgi:citrate lyase subunit beta/citryl-CoA lyase
MIDKARGLPSDMVFLDLEDAVAPGAKEQARSTVVAGLLSGGFAAHVVSVRINDVRTPWALGDVRAVMEQAAGRFDTLMLPKCSAPGDVAWLDLTLAMLERSAGVDVGSVGIEVQIEDAAGLTSIDAILAASPRIEAVHVGPGDLHASLRIPTTSLGRSGPDGDPFHHVLGRILVAARTAGTQVLDGPFPAISDIPGLVAAARRVAAMGYDGKWVLHPTQVDPVNAAFTPDQDAFDHAERVLAAYDVATSAAGGLRGAILHDGEMVDEATRRMASTVQQRGRAAGMVPTADGPPSP